MVLPLRSVETVCGHITLVGAQLLGLPLVVTRAIGIEDYVRDGENALLVSSGSVADVVAALRKIKDEPALSASLGKCASNVARKENSLSRWVSYFETKAAEFVNSGSSL
jgi:glycosyltransferase involved in cell wall biosynthesis